MKYCIILIMAGLFSCNCSFGQSCPPNIGFEKGSFDEWTCLTGRIDRQGIINLPNTGEVNGRHSLFSNSITPQVLDRYGNFPVNCPNGSNYSIRLGNDMTGAQAERATYTFTVPASQGDYSMIYHYAVVFQNPLDHLDFEQPKFTVKVFNVTDNQYVTCGAFEFISAPNLPGFKQSSISNIIFYKEWAPITLRLPGYAGKTLRLEFTVNDCTRGGHFGYAYLDVNENCTTPITGNVLCNGISTLTLTAPYGFSEYRWYTDDFSKLLGTTNVLKLFPAPPPNTRYALQIVPFPNQGCLDTLYTTVTHSTDPCVLEIAASLSECEPSGVNLTSPQVSTGSTPGLRFSYFTDAGESVFVSTPQAVKQSGWYYIRGTNAAGCTATKPIEVKINKAPGLTIHQPAPVCTPATVNLTAPEITAGNEQGNVYSYWEDATATQPLLNPHSINKTGVYHIRAVNGSGCTITKPVTVSLSDPPKAVVHNRIACGGLSIADANPTAGSDPSASVTYWQDAAASTGNLSLLHVFTASSTYYIKLTALTGCAVIREAQVTINPYPSFTVNSPIEVRLPSTVDLTASVPASSNWNYSYWMDSAATQPLASPHEVSNNGTYFIKATTAAGCEVVNPVKVIVGDAEIIPPNIFSPNKDGINDTWQIPLLRYYPGCTVEIFSRSGQPVFRSVGYKQPWNGKKNEADLPLGTYYYIIRLSSKHNAMSGSITLVY